LRLFPSWWYYGIVPGCPVFTNGMGWTLRIGPLFKVHWDYIPGYLNGKMVHWDGQNSCWTFSGMLDNPQQSHTYNTGTNINMCITNLFVQYTYICTLYNIIRKMFNLMIQNPEKQLVEPLVCEQ